jgi:hypothetical protein
VLHVLRAFIGVAPVAVAGAVCLGVIACGGSVSAGAPSAAAPTATSSGSAMEPVLSMGGETMFASGAASGAGGVADPLRNLSGEQVYAEAVDDADATPSTTYTGKYTKSGASYELTIVITRSNNCAMTLGQGGAHLEELLVIGKTAYLNLSAKYFTSPLGRASTAEPAALMALADKWIKLSPNGKNAVQLASLIAVCGAFHRFKDGIAGATYTKEPVTALDGVRVVPVETSEGGAYDGTYYITDTAKPEFVEEAGGEASAGLGTFVIKVGAPLTLAAPPASQVVDGSAIGL